MITLAANDTIAGGASVASQVTCTIFGMELNGSTETYKVLDQRQLASSPATIYTATANGPTFVKSILVVNNDTVNRTFQLFRGGTAAANAITPAFTLLFGGCAVYEDGKGWQFYNASGQLLTATFNNSGVPVTNILNTVVLSGDVVNNNGTANTIADVTGLSFDVVAGQTYWFEFVIPYTSAATTTGSRWAINGPAAPTMLNMRSEYTLTATTTTVNSITAYDIPAASNASSLTTGNVATIWGIITPSQNGTVVARFASEISSSAITAKAGATLRWMRII